MSIKKATPDYPISERRPAKPKMVYFQANPSGYAPVNFEGTVLRPLKNFQEFFDVTIIHEDCDYDEICQRYEPDISLFDCGDEAPGSRLKITNLSSNLTVPRIGFMKGDAWSSSRIQCLYQIETYRLEALFEQGDLALKEYMPDLSEIIFYFPYFIDTDLYRDYGLPKLIPLLFIGDFNRPAYPWRKRIKARIVSSFPSLEFPHPGYSSGYSASFSIHGETYARTINASLIVPSGGAFNKQFLKKHLEILACRACLLTDESPAVKAFGFRHKENCIFCDEDDVVEAVSLLFKNRDELERIIHEGYEFVHSNHSYKNRKQLIQWYELRNKLTPGQKVIQQDPFRDLQIIDGDSIQKSMLFLLDGDDKKLLKKGDQSLSRGDYTNAIMHYEEAGRFTSCIPEADLKMAICYLFTGEPGMALLLAEKINRHAYAQNSPMPDPVEWAYLLIALLCNGYVTKAADLANCTLSHAELEWARWAIAVAADDEKAALRSMDRIRMNAFISRSIHKIPISRPREHIVSLSGMLSSCGKKHLAKKILGKKGDLTVLAEDGKPDHEPLSHTTTPYESGFDFKCALDSASEITSLPIYRIARKKLSIQRDKKPSFVRFYLHLMPVIIQWPYLMMRSSNSKTLRFITDALMNVRKMVSS